MTVSRLMGDFDLIRDHDGTSCGGFMWLQCLQLNVLHHSFFTLGKRQADGDRIPAAGTSSASSPSSTATGVLKSS